MDHEGNRHGDSGQEAERAAAQRIERAATRLQAAQTRDTGAARSDRARAAEARRREDLQRTDRIQKVAVGWCAGPAWADRGGQEDRAARGSSEGGDGACCTRPRETKGHILSAVRAHGRGLARP